MTIFIIITLAVLLVTSIIILRKRYLKQQREKEIILLNISVNNILTCLIENYQHGLNILPDDIYLAIPKLHELHLDRGACYAFIYVFNIDYNLRNPENDLKIKHMDYIVKIGFSILGKKEILYWMKCPGDASTIPEIRDLLHVRLQLLIQIQNKINSETPVTI